jgi:hypothetical protein
MARATTPTLLSLDDFAQTLGINPAHFNGAYAGEFIWAPCGDCRDFWSQYSWQCNTGLSRDRLAMVIAEAEQQVSRYLSRPLTPTMRSKVFPYQSHTCVDGKKPAYYIGDHIENYRPYVWTDLFEASVEDMTLTYYDLDNDDFAETGRIEFSTDTAITDCDIGVFNAGHAGEAAWRISSPKNITVTYNSGTEEWDVVVDIEVWKLIDPERWEEPPNKANLIGCCMRALDMSNVENLVTAVSLSRLVESVDFPLVEYIYEQAASCCNSPDCLACTVNKTYGCYTDQARESGLVVPTPATFDEDTQSWCSTSTLSSCSSVPRMVRIYYWVGCTDEYDGNDRCGECLNPALKQIIAYLAMARLTMGSCDCDCNAGMQWKSLGEDMSVNTGGGRYFSFETLSNPFGLLRGEIMAWQRLRAYLGNNAVVTYGGF